MKLEPCPFCGGEHVNFWGSDDCIDGFPGYTVYCKDCGAETRDYGSKEYAAAMWNRRPGTKWIPVEEGLPKDRTNVIVTHKDGVSVGSWDGYAWTGRIGGDHILSTVYAWTEFPEGFKRIKKKRKKKKGGQGHG